MSEGILDIDREFYSNSIVGFFKVLVRFIKKNETNDIFYIKSELLWLKQINNFISTQISASLVFRDESKEQIVMQLSMGNYAGIDGFFLKIPSSMHNEITNYFFHLRNCSFNELQSKATNGSIYELMLVYCVDVLIAQMNLFIIHLDFALFFIPNLNTFIIQHNKMLENEK